jgi:hypothetical protein
VRLTTTIILAGWVFAGSAIFPSPARGQCAYDWLPGEGLAAVDGIVYATTVWDDGRGPALYVGGDFHSAGQQAANSIARWDGAEWEVLNSGMNGPVEVLTVYDGHLIAGGDFTTAGGANAQNIARWDGCNWHPLGSRLDGRGVHSLGVYNGRLIAGGEIYLGGLPVDIAGWDGATWQPLGGGVAGSAHRVLGVLSLAVYGTELIVGGDFDRVSNDPDRRTFIPSPGIARWDGSAWHAMGSGLATPGYPGCITALTIHHGKLIAGGCFTSIDGVSANHITQWDGDAWEPLGSGLEPSPLFIRPLNTLTVYNGDLVAGGSFLTAGGSVANGIARWDGSIWHPLGTGVGGTSPEVYDLAVFDGQIIASGTFTLAGGRVSAHLARWGPTGTSDVAADFDTDCDVDMADASIFLACAAGPAVAYDPADLPEGCTLTPDQGRIAADFDRDGDVDQSDFGAFQRCYSGAGRIADAECAN